MSQQFPKQVWWAVLPLLALLLACQPDQPATSSRATPTRPATHQVTDGGQMRDFVYVKDVVEVCYFLMHHRRNSGIYNLGSGEARTFLDLALNTFAALGRTADIHFVDTPEDIRDKYQYFTQADMRKLCSVGYDRPFTRLEDGIQDYVRQYLVPGAYY